MAESDMSDGELPNTFEDTEQGLALVNVQQKQPTAAQVQRDIVVKLADRALSLEMCRLPLRSDADYDVNDYQLWDLLNPDPFQAQPIDIQRRIKMACRFLHPDKLSAHSREVQLWGTQQTQLLMQARDEALSRLPRFQAQKRTNIQSHAQDYLEFPERFQMALLETFQPCICVLSSSEVRYSSAANSDDHGHFLSAEAGKQFYRALLDFTQPVKTPLLELLAETWNQDVRNTSWIIVLSKVPAEFPTWWCDQLISMKAAGVEITIHAIFLLDALPTKWPQIDLLCDLPVLSAEVKPFILQCTYFSPSTVALVSTGMSPMKLLKKVKAVTFTTTEFTSRGLDKYVEWRPSDLDAFVAGHTLVVDFPREDALHVQKIMQVLGNKLNADLSPAPSRSRGNSAENKRQVLELNFNFLEQHPDELDYIQTLRDDLHQHNLSHVLVGWGLGWQLQEEVFVFTFDSLKWTHDLPVREVLMDVVLVSRSKALARLGIKQTTEHLRQQLVSYNMSHEDKFRRLYDHEGNLLWSDSSPRTTALTAKPPLEATVLSRCMEVSLQGVGKKEFASQLQTLLASATQRMTADGFAFQGHSIRADIKPNGKKRQPSATLWFPTETCARGFYFRYNEYVWEAEDESKRIVIHLLHAQFQREASRPEAKALIASGGRIGPTQLHAAGGSSSGIANLSPNDGVSAPPAPAGTQNSNAAIRS